MEIFTESEPNKKRKYDEREEDSIKTSPEPIVIDGHRLNYLIEVATIFHSDLPLEFIHGKCVEQCIREAGYDRGISVSS